MLCHQFSLEVVLQWIPKNNPTGKQNHAEIQAIVLARKLTEEKTLKLSLQITRTDLHHKLQVLNPKRRCEICSKGNTRDCHFSLTLRLCSSVFLVHCF